MLTPEMEYALNDKFREARDLLEMWKKYQETAGIGEASVRYYQALVDGYQILWDAYLRASAVESESDRLRLLVDELIAGSPRGGK